jgi:hypothetical protein
MEFFDFNSENEFDLKNEYSKLGTPNLKTPVDRKVTDAEAIILELGSKYVEGASLDTYEKLFANIETFLRTYRTDSDIVNNMVTDDRDKLFGYGVNMFKMYENLYQNLIFNFEISKDEWHFIDNVLNKKLKYNGQELFNYWQLRGEFLDPVGKQFKSLPKEIPSLVVTTSVRNMVLLSHLLMKHEETGGNKSFYHFKDVLLEIAQMTKLFNAYGVMSERISNKVSQWINTLNALDGYNDEETRIKNMDVVEDVIEIQEESS